ncbi:GNAT family N-acetyltransferase [Microvirga guangxiensis]|uniref:Acetyltransferase (GNAT) family protein n=1 Tax=Microvirga guangxiensis TaxID=549386 RepID=A0A1G5JSZ2_9HYPH|nr:GNAT family N-acetyltransferase [Microvirga guangxiensis]SCY90858.1 Acetyltransferase (GNAT) family protein [Microvirga guangxiensis]
MAMQSEVSIREAKVEDVPKLVVVMKELADGEDLSAYIETYEARLREQAFGPTPRIKVLLAELDGEIVGLVSCTVRSSNGGELEFIKIDELVVREDARGRGIGQALMQRLNEVVPHRGRL